ncbi:3-oxoacyl-ACP synthase [Streptomyces sp. NEAU-sy36]|uniref:3-oxoacyl-ACP synthase III family protein n=1 Tax=unclassified Streptomyces TaxID=2593676 RepID=UPI0015D5BE9F|nr:MULTISPECIES: 3-oxoacyl-[acyl-carrier-protein] synthase III C-terminal domain-containing protein [unclassified Streptomyces]QLJ00582.1 3-oxoacyl-ACP synthase [Streptomyces sp. NEAU-sy36]
MAAIADIEIRYPASHVTVEGLHATAGLDVDEIHEIVHCDAFPALGEGESSWRLAWDAARAMLQRTPGAVSSVRQVIFAGSGEWDLPFWSPAARVAQALGIHDAHCFEVTNFCNAGTTALRVASDALAHGEPGGYALVLIADRLSRMVDRSDPASKALFNFGDAAAAVLLARDGGVLPVLHTAMRTDPSWSDYYYGERRDSEVVIRRGPHRKGLAQAYVENFTTLVGRSLAALGRTTGDISYFLVNQGDREMHTRLLRTLGIPESRSVLNYHRLGHMGGADTFIALRDLVDERRLRPGDLILLATSAMGFTWGVTSLEYRP